MSGLALLFFPTLLYVSLTSSAGFLISWDGIKKGTAVICSNSILCDGQIPELPYSVRDYLHFISEVLDVPF